MTRLAATQLIAAFSPGHWDLTRFHLWSPIATGNYLDRLKRIQIFAQTSGTADVCGPRSGIWGHIYRRSSEFPNLHK